MTTHTIYCPPELRSLWPRPLAREWRERYPMIFDDLDFEQAESQRSKHFFEWFTAIHLFHSGGYLSLIEKAQFGVRHPRKNGVLRVVVGDVVLKELHALSDRHGAQWPDLFVYHGHSKEFWFAEVKGPGDTLSESQAAVNRSIEAELGIPVHQYLVRYPSGLP